MTPTPKDETADVLREAIRSAKQHAGRVLGISWCNLEEISRFELVFAALSDRAAEREGEEAELVRLRVLASKVDAIRNSIVGVQGFNWSEHAYPLVAALGEAGYPSEEYEIARENVGTLIEQIKAAEAELDALSLRLEAVEGAAQEAYTQGYRDASSDGDVLADMECARDGWHDWLAARDALATTGGAK